MLLVNAIDALETVAYPGEIVLRTRHHTDSDEVSIAIADNGPGIPLAVRSLIFDPFFTTKPVGKGTGLGLAIAYQIVVERHGGNLVCRDRPEGGTEFTVQLPVRPGQGRC